MSKEMVISANPHETRVAILEEGQLCEYYVEREKEFALVGSIYKGKVTRVLPGMQSAFVEIGLDSDAFLYVSDFLEEIEELDHVVTAVEDKPRRWKRKAAACFPPIPAPPRSSNRWTSSPRPRYLPSSLSPASPSPEATRRRHLPPQRSVHPAVLPAAIAAVSKIVRAALARWRPRRPLWPSRRSRT